MIAAADKLVAGLLLAFPCLAAMLFLASCGSTSTSTSGQHTQPPILTYGTPSAVYTKGTAISPDAPSNTGGAVTSYSVTPALPAGLSLDTATGVVSGTPTTVTAQAPYTVTGGNAGGNSRVRLTITVNDVAPAGLTYSAPTATYAVAAAIAPDIPSWSNTGGTPTNFSVNGALPQGLAIDPATGIIRGIPTTQAPQANYTITASNTGGSTPSTLTLTIIPEAPYIILQPVSQSVGTGIFTNLGVSAGGGGILAYHWYKNNVAIPGANGFVYTTPVLTSGDSGDQFNVVVRDNYSRSATSGTATLTIQGISGSFSNTGAPTIARECHTATLLKNSVLNGRVLVVGGRNGNTALASAEIYDPSSGTFTATGSLATERCAHTATRLNDGKVLVVGGYNFGTGGMLPTLATAELYDPATGTFSATGSLGTGRAGHSATLLGNGQVLVAGGINSDQGTVTLASAELYDPGTGNFSPTGPLNTARSAPATLLNNGQVLIAGGSNLTTGDLGSAEIYDQTAGTFALTDSLITARSSHSATVLQNGKVLIAGGNNNGGASFLTSAELYDPVARTFAATGSLNNQHEGQTATLLPNGQVLLAGGNVSAVAQPSLNMTELYDPASGVFIFNAPTISTRTFASATLLTNGTVLITGQETSAITTTQPVPAELYLP